MNDIKTSNQQDDFDDFGWILPSDNPTDENIALYLSPAPEGCPQYTDNWPNEMAKKAQHKGAITLNNLRYIMAGEKKYTSEILSRIWENSGLNRDNREEKIIGIPVEQGIEDTTTENQSHRGLEGIEGKIQIEKKEVQYPNKTPQWDLHWTETIRGRAWIWTWILLKWTIYPYFKGEGGLEIESYYFGDLYDPYDGALLAVYKDDNKILKKIEDTEEQSMEQFVMLSELEEYLKKIDKNLPLPAFLFSEQNHEDTIWTKTSQESIALKVEKAFKDLQLINLLKEVKPKMESLVSDLKEVAGFSYDRKDREEKLQEEAINWFNDQEDEGFFKEKYFEDRRIYDTDPKQTPRDFIGALLKKIVKDQLGKKMGGQVLYEVYKKI